MPSFLLIHPTVWPQYTNVTDRTGQDGQTDRQTDRQIAQRSYSIGRTVLQTVAQKMVSREIRTVSNTGNNNMLFCLVGVDEQVKAWHSSVTNQCI